MAKMITGSCSTPINLMISEKIQSRVLLTLTVHPKLQTEEAQAGAMLHGSAQATCDILGLFAEK